MKWRPGQREAFDAELSAAASDEARGEARPAFAHLERAHILGQRSTWAHASVHWRMLRFGWRRRDVREVAGQVPRILAALTNSMLWVPTRNTGGVDVHPLRPMPIPHDLRRWLE